MKTGILIKVEKLPRKNNRKEADLTPRIIAWFERNYDHSVALEIKMQGGRVLPHQRASLIQVSSGVFSYKLPDMGKRLPFDAFILHGADAFIVWVNPKTRECIAKDPITNVEQFRFTIHS